MRIGEPSISRDRESASAVGSAGRDAAEIIRENLDFSIESGEGDLSIPVIIEFEINPAAIFAPDRCLDVTIQVLGHNSRAGAVPVHHIKPGDFVAAIAIVETCVSDLAAIR